MTRWGVVVMLWVGALGPGGACVARAAPRGARLFLEHCAPCHGPDGRGNGPDADLSAARPRDLHDGVLNRYDTPALVRRIREGRALALPLDPVTLRARIRDVDTIEAHLRRIPAVDWPAVRRGMIPYAAYCESCHGPFGETTDHALDLADPGRQKRLDDGALRAVIHRGHGGMPPLPDLVTADRERDLVAFVRILSPGFIRYARYCAPCHGDDGHPPAALPTTFRRPSVVFDSAYFSRTRTDELETAIWHMLDDKTPRMPHFAPVLKDEEMTAIVEYLRADPPAKAR
jgi:mono/diheme cytochrome c family protein